MPSKFTANLPGVNPVDSRPAIIHDDSLQSVAEAATAVGEVAYKRIDDNILKTAVAETSSILQGVQDYEQEKRSLLLASSVADKEHLAEYQAELTKLRNGEKQGYISPSAAQLQLQILSRTRQNRYPHLADQFRKLAEQSITGVKDIMAAQEQQDPDVAAAYDIIKEAAKKNQTPHEYLEDISAARIVEHSKQRLEEAKLVGTNLEGPTQALVMDFANESINKVMGAILAAGRTGTLIKEDEVAKLMGLKSNLSTTISAMILKQEMDTGGKFSPEFKNSLKSQLDAALDPLVTMAQSMDTKDKQMRFLEYANKRATLQGRADFMKEYGQFGLLALDGSAGAFAFISKIGDFQNQIKRGMRPELEKRASNGDSEVAFLLAALDSGKLGNITAQKLGEINNGNTPQSTGNKAVDKAIAGHSWAVINDPTLPMDIRVKQFKAAMQDKGIFSDGLETALDNKAALQLIRTNPEAQAGALDALHQRQAGAMSALRVDHIPIIFYDRANKQYIVDPAFVAAENQTAAPTWAGENSAFANPNPNPYPDDVMKVIDSLNLGLKLQMAMGKDVGEYTANITKALTRLYGNDAPQKPKAGVSQDTATTLQLTPEDMTGISDMMNYVPKNLPPDKLAALEAEVSPIFDDMAAKLMERAKNRKATGKGSSMLTAEEAAAYKEQIKAITLKYE